ncbi:GumC family protein [Aquisediminimonas sediminicola]|uniref:GumC family protein n=1 Tax=Alteraquisediminimonas sediminicola TaxID=2676787 RepID=UPI001C8D47A6|nr:Wzz/FepE/Etk N-terminal domain-containing protein [Aquisediminimonas sediminicola]
MNINDRMLNIDDIKAFIFRAAPLVILAVIGFMTVAIAYSLAATKIYEATARVIVEPRTQNLTGNQEALSGLQARDQGVVDTEVHFLQSGTVAERVVRDAQLMQDPEFAEASTDATIKRFAKALDIRRVGMTYLIDIAVRAQSPSHAALLANKAAAAYLALQQERKRAATSLAGDLLSRRVASMASEVGAAEAEVQTFRRSHNLMSVNGTTLAEQNAAQLNAQLATAQADERAAIDRLHAATQDNVATDTAHAQNSLAPLHAQQAAAMQEMGVAQSRYGERHPNYIATREKLDEINRALVAETVRARSAIIAARQNELANLRAQAAAATGMRQSIEASATANAAGLNRNSQAYATLAELERKASALRSTYENYLTRYQQTSTQLGTERPDSAIISPATSPLAPHSPHLVYNVIIAVLGGLVVGVLVSALGMMLESHFSTGHQVEQSLDVDALPILPTIASAGLFPKRANPDITVIVVTMLTRPMCAFTKMHISLLAAISRPLATGVNQVIALTSAIPNEGKTTSAVCLAALAANAGRRTIIIDGDLRRQHATDILLGRAAKKGLVDILDGDAALEDTLIRDLPGGFDLLPAAPLSSGRLDIFSAPQFGALIKNLRQHYDLILIDTAPILPVFDTRILLEHVDSVMFLCRWRKTARRTVEAALAIIGRTGAPIAGLCLTQVDLTQIRKFSYGGPHYTHHYADDDGRYV